MKTEVGSFYYELIDWNGEVRLHAKHGKTRLVWIATWAVPEGEWEDDEYF